MSVRNRSRMNAVMGHFMTAVYLALPTTCVTVVAYDIYNNGLASLPAQMGIGILGLFTGLRLLSYGFAAADAIMIAGQKSRPTVKSLVAPWSRWFDKAAIPQSDRTLATA